MEAAAMAFGEADLAAHGILIDQNLPASQSFCQDETTVRIASDLTFSWQVAHKPCPGGATDPILQWELCLEPGSECVQPVVLPEMQCSADGTLQLVDVFLGVDVWWIVAERAGQPFAGLNFVERSIGGRKMTL
jgi:hypothetical protein